MQNTCVFNVHNNLPSLHIAAAINKLPFPVFVTDQGSHSIVGMRVISLKLEKYNLNDLMKKPSPRAADSDIIMR